MDRVHAGLIKEKDCAEVADGHLDLTSPITIHGTNVYLSTFD